MQIIQQGTGDAGRADSRNPGQVGVPAPDGRCAVAVVPGDHVFAPRGTGVRPAARPRARLRRLRRPGRCGPGRAPHRARDRLRRLLRRSRRASLCGGPSAADACARPGVHARTRLGAAQASRPLRPSAVALRPAVSARGAAAAPPRARGRVSRAGRPTRVRARAASNDRCGAGLADAHGPPRLDDGIRRCRRAPRPGSRRRRSS